MPDKDSQPRHVALLRGINVGGRNRLSMDDLSAAFLHVGCRDVETYIASGNVLFSASEELYAAVPDVIASAVERLHGLSVAIITRTAEEFAAAIRANPWAAQSVDAKTVHMAFLRDRPQCEAVALLPPGRSPPDEFVVRGRHIYLRCPHGLGKSKLTNRYFERALDTACTVRNWRTALKLHDLSRGAAPTREYQEGA